MDLSLLIARSCQPEGLPLSVTCRAGLLVTRSLWFFFVCFFCFMFNMGTPSFLLRVWTLVLLDREFLVDSAFDTLNVSLHCLSVWWESSRHACQGSLACDGSLLMLLSSVLLHLWQFMICLSVELFEFMLLRFIVTSSIKLGRFSSHISSSFLSASFPLLSFCARCHSWRCPVGVWDAVYFLLLFFLPVPHTGYLPVFKLVGFFSCHLKSVEPLFWVVPFRYFFHL